MFWAFCETICSQFSSFPVFQFHHTAIEFNAYVNHEQNRLSKKNQFKNGNFQQERDDSVSQENCFVNRSDLGKAEEPKKPSEEEEAKECPRGQQCSDPEYDYQGFDRSTDNTWQISPNNPFECDDGHCVSQVGLTII